MEDNINLTSTNTPDDKRPEPNEGNVSTNVKPQNFTTEGGLPLSQKQGRKFPPILKILIAFVIIIVIAFLIYIIYKSKFTPSTNNNSANQVSSTFKYNPQHNYTVELKQNPGCESKDPYLYCKADIYLTDQATNQSLMFMTTNNVEHDSRVPVLINGRLFLIKRFYNINEANLNTTVSLGQNSDWTDELWVYDLDGSGTKLYSTKGVRYSVNNDASLVAVEPAGSPADLDTVRVIPIGQTQNFTDFKPSPEYCMPNANTRDARGVLDLRNWDKSGKVIWGAYVGEFSAVGCFWSINTTTSKITYYQVPESIGAIPALNVDKKLAAYEDFPFFADQESYNSWVNTHTTYSIYFYNLQTQNSTKIDTFPSSSHQAPVYIKWDNDTTLSYTNSSGTKTYNYSQ